MKKKIKDAINYINKTNDLSKIRDKLVTFHPADLSIIFEKFDEPQRSKVYQALDDHELALLFSYLDNPVKYLNKLKPEKVTSILENMEIDDASHILNEIFDEDLKEAYLENLDPEMKDDLEYISKIEDNKVGSIISTNYISVELGMDVKQAMRKLVKEADEFELIDPIFVTNNEELVGVISLNDLIIARSPKLVDQIMEDNPISIDVNEEIPNATRIIRNYALTALPVTDNHKLVGIITSDDAFEIYSDIADNKYANLAGVATEDIGDKRLFKRLIERLPWLIALLALSIVTTNLMGVFEGVIQQVTILVFFQTLIFDMAGNVGTQSLAVTIQTLIHNNNLTNKEIKKHAFKEIKINLINAILLMVISFIVCFIFVSIYDKSISAISVAFVISLSMGVTLVLSSFFGAIFPIILSKMKINPAVASGPLITTINDIVSILVYFSLAALFLNIAF